MKMRKKALLTMLVSLCCLMASAQSIRILFNDGTSVTYETSKITKITTVDVPANYLNGKWYLGFWKSGSSSIHFDGTEYLSFNGNEMEWAGRQDGSDQYSIEYTDDYSKIKLTKKSDGSEVTWTIKKYSGNVLVLDDGYAERYFYPTQEAAKNASLDLEEDVSAILAKASGKTASSITPMGTHFENRHATTDSDRSWLLNPDNEPDMVAGLTRWLDKGVNLYPFGNPVPADINQHAIGDCCACSVFTEMSYLYPGFVKSILHDNGNGTYTVDMFDPQGKKVQVCVNGKVLCDSNGNIGQLTGKNNAVTWATIFEKAVMKWQKVYAVDGIEGIGTEHVAPLFTGCGDSFAYGANALSTDELRKIVKWALRKGMISIGGFTKSDLQCGPLKSVTAHAFAYMLPKNSNSVIDMRNPWGIESVDGVLEIPDDRSIVETIDARLVYPGAAEPYLISNLQPYYPPKWTPRKDDLGVSPRLIKMMKKLKNNSERW